MGELGAEVWAYSKGLGLEGLQCYRTLGGEARRLLALWALGLRVAQHSPV